MITIWLAAVIALVSGLLGVFCAAICGAAGHADECERCTGRGRK